MHQNWGGSFGSWVLIFVSESSKGVYVFLLLLINRLLRETAVLSTERSSVTIAVFKAESSEVWSLFVLLAFH